MSLVELMPSVNSLPRADKLRLFQILAHELADEQGIGLLVTKGEYPIWTPISAYGAADTMLRMLKEHKASNEYTD